MAVVSMSYLLEAGVHFGHQTKRWNPKMKEYIFTARDDIYIIDLQKTVRKIEESYKVLRKIAENGGRVLFVGTKKQAQEAMKEEAERTGMYYINERWLGGTLTNFRTIRRRINRLDEIEKMEQNKIFDILPKKEVIKLRREYDRLIKYLGGMREMRKLPEAMIIVDPRKETNAIKEAKKLNIPIFGIIDTNCDPDDVDYPIPANDDAIRAVKLVIGVLNNAIAEATGKPMIDFLTEEDKSSNTAKNFSMENAEAKAAPVEEKIEKKVEVKEVPSKKEEPKKEAPKKEEPKKEAPKKEEPKKESKVDYKKLTVLELKQIAKEKGIEGYSKMRKEQLIESLK